MENQTIEFLSKNKGLPIGDQHKKFTPKDYRKLRQFFKHATSEETRQWIITAMENNRVYTQNEVVKACEEIRQEYVTQMAELSKENRRFCETIETQTDEINELNKTNNELVLLRFVYEGYLSTPWYKRIFMGNPLTQ